MLSTKVNTSGGTMLCTVPWGFINSCLLAHSSVRGQEFGLVVQVTLAFAWRKRGPGGAYGKVH